MADRSTCIIFQNATPVTLTRSSEKLDHGTWSDNLLPPDVIGGGLPNIPNPATWQSESQGLATGTQGETVYLLPDLETTLTIDWDNPYWGSNANQATMTGPSAGLYTCTVTGGDGDNATVTVAFSLASTQDQS